MAKYGVLVSYSYLEAFKHRCVIRSEVMSLDYLPNTPSGLKKITEELGREYPYKLDICVLNLTPLNNDPKPREKDDDWE